MWPFFLYVCVRLPSLLRCRRDFDSTPSLVGTVVLSSPLGGWLKAGERALMMVLVWPDIRTAAVRSTFAQAMKLPLYLANDTYCRSTEKLSDFLHQPGARHSSFGVGLDRILPALFWRGRGLGDG